MAEATELAPSGEVSLAGAVSRSGMRWAIVVAAGVAVLGGFLMLAASARADVATASLLLVGVSLVLCLRTMHRMVSALSRDNLEVVVENEGEYGGISGRDLREERRRLLRAINELRFDHEMGKLSKADYDTVRLGYELRAVEVMRALDDGRSLHPELAARLGLAVVTPDDPIAVTRADPGPPAEPAGLPAGDSPTGIALVESSPVESSPLEADVVRCAACGKNNDTDARFCKHCGKEVAA